MWKRFYDWLGIKSDLPLSLKQLLSCVWSQLRRRLSCLSCDESIRKFLRKSQDFAVEFLPQKQRQLNTFLWHESWKQHEEKVSIGFSRFTLYFWKILQSAFAPFKYVRKNLIISNQTEWKHIKNQFQSFFGTKQTTALRFIFSMFWPKNFKENKKSNQWHYWARSNEVTECVFCFSTHGNICAQFNNSIKASRRY